MAALAGFLATWLPGQLPVEYEEPVAIWLPILMLVASVAMAVVIRAQRRSLVGLALGVLATSGVYGLFQFLLLVTGNGSS